MAQPTDPLIIWAADDVTLPISGQPNKVRPQDTLIATGWDKTQKPSAEEFNAILNNLARWIQYYGSDAASNYLEKIQNLNDLSDKPTARSNLDVYSKSEVDGKTINAGSGLIDGGTLGSNPTINMGTPNTVGNGSTNSVEADTHSHNLTLTTSNISILTGTVGNGGTIPLPAGYSESQCKWVAIPAFMSDVSQNDMANFQVTVSGRVVTVLVDSAAYVENYATYMIIGVK